MMTKEEFEEAVHSFSHCYAGEYARSTPTVAFDYEDEELWRATVTFEAHGKTWAVPVALLVGRETPGIELGEDYEPVLDMDGQGLYEYLWHAACDQLDVFGAQYKSITPRAL